MKPDQSQLGKDPASHVGTSHALRRALNEPLLIDRTADADFARLINRLRCEPGSNNGGKQ